MEEDQREKREEEWKNKVSKAKENGEELPLKNECWVHDSEDVNDPDRVFFNVPDIVMRHKRPDERKEKLPACKELYTELPCKKKTV